MPSQRCCRANFSSAPCAPPTQLAQLSREEMHVLGREYVHAIGDALVRARNDPESPAGQRLVSILHGRLAGCQTLTVDS